MMRGRVALIRALTYAAPWPVPDATASSVPYPERLHPPRAGFIDAQSRAGRNLNPVQVRE